MHRCSSGFLLTFAVTLIIALTGCLGKSTSNNEGSVLTVSISPSDNFSMDVGSTQVFSATATNSSGHTVLGTITFNVTIPPSETGPAPISVTSGGNVCAGNWDPTGSICSPGAPGIALVTAVVNGVSSAQTTVYVHFHIASLQVAPAQQQQPPYDCFSQGQTWLYQAVAFDSNGNDITNTIGPVNWATTNANVFKTATLLPNMPFNQVQITANNPGITPIYAFTSGTTSNSLQLTTCLVQYVRLQADGYPGSTISVNTGGTITLRAFVVDTLGNVLAKPPLTWSTTNPEVVSFSSLTNSTGTNNATARANLGGSAITASCTPPSCNVGILPGMPVYASGGVLSPNNPQIGFGTISVDVTTAAKPPVYGGWAATGISPTSPNGGCDNASGCNSVMFQITPGTANNPIISSANMSRTPNSFMFNYQSSPRAYLGSNQGLMYIDVSSSSASVTPVSQSSTPCNVALCGTVLAISNDGKQVVVSDDVSTTPQVYIYNNSNTSSTDLVLPSNLVATAAAFSPDQSKIFILTNAGSLYVYSTVDALALVPLSTSGTDVAFSADGSFAYAAGTSGAAGAVAAFSTCSVPGLSSKELGSVDTTGAPLQIFPSPNVQATADSITQNVYVLSPPNVQALTAQWAQSNVPDGEYACIPPTLQSFTANPTLYNLGQGSFIPLYARLVANGSELIVLAQGNPSVLIFNPASGTTSSIHLTRPGYTNIYPLGASASTDGSEVWVAACDQYDPDGTTCSAGSVHIVNTISGGDYQQVPYINNSTNNMCNNVGGTQPLCVANLVAIRPQ
ncbi:MAG: hypothetical protein ABSG70_19370 [Terriglobales bacterium]|jgi:hypothetical protein